MADLWTAVADYYRTVVRQPPFLHGFFWSVVLVWLFVVLPMFHIHNKDKDKKTLVDDRVKQAQEALKDPEALETAQRERQAQSTTALMAMAAFIAVGLFLAHVIISLNPPLSPGDAIVFLKVLILAFGAGLTILFALLNETDGGAHGQSLLLPTVVAGAGAYLYRGDLAQFYAMLDGPHSLAVFGAVVFVLLLPPIGGQAISVLISRLYA